MPINIVRYVDGFIAYQNYYFYNEITREPDCSRREVGEFHNEEECKRFCETYNLENPTEEIYYYEPGKIQD